MDRFEAESMALLPALLPGQRVRVRILSHHPWGVNAEIIGYEQVAASADLTGQCGAAVSPDELLAVFPRVGAVIDAVVAQVRRWDPPARVRLSIRPQDLESFTWPVIFAGSRPSSARAAAALPSMPAAPAPRAAARSSPTGHAWPAGCTRAAPGEPGSSGPG